MFIKITSSQGNTRYINTSLIKEFFEDDYVDTFRNPKKLVCKTLAWYIDNTAEHFLETPEEIFLLINQTK